MEVGELFIKGNPLSFLGVLIVAAGLGWINRTIMTRNLYAELAKTNDTKINMFQNINFWSNTVKLENTCA
jgi:hypothetical protein